MSEVPITRRQVSELSNSSWTPKSVTESLSKEELQKRYVEELIDRLLIFQEWDRLRANGASIPPYVMEDRIDTIIRDEFGGDRSKFLESISKNGYTLESFRERELLRSITQSVTFSQTTALFKDHPASSPEERERERQDWLQKLRATSKIQYFLAS